MLKFQINAHNLIKSLTNRRGQGLVEYSLILVLIAVVVVAAVTLVGGNLNTTYCKISTSLP
jgi:pilus assembly protein Flp/PilA